MNTTDLLEITREAWRLIDSAGQRRENYILSVSSSVTTTSSQRDAPTYTILYIPFGKAPVVEVVAMYESHNALVTFNQKLHALSLAEVREEQDTPA